MLSLAAPSFAQADCRALSGAAKFAGHRPPPVALHLLCHFALLNPALRHPQRDGAVGRTLGDWKRDSRCTEEKQPKELGDDAVDVQGVAFYFQPGSLYPHCVDGYAVDQDGPCV